MVLHGKMSLLKYLEFFMVVIFFVSSALMKMLMVIPV